MSDYFASLMRASAPAAVGMPAGDRGEGVPAARPMATAGADHAPQTPSTFAATVPPTPLAQPTSVAAAPERAAPPLAPAPEPDATIPARDVVIHAAMRWVAQGDAPPARLDAPPPSPRAQSSKVAQTHDVPAPSPAITRASDDRAAPAVDVRITAPTPLPAQAALADHAMPARAPLKAPVTTDIEVSIGAIHLRVDAPPAVSAAPPAAKPQSQRAAAPSPAVRGSLARRALRRI